MKNIKVIYKDGLEIDYSNVRIIKSLDEYSKVVDLIADYFDISINEIKEIETLVGHGYTNLTAHGLTIDSVIGNRINSMSPKDKDRKRIANYLTTLKGSVITDQIKFLLEGNMLVIQKNYSYFTIPYPLKDDEKYIKNYIITDSDKVYTEDDIKVKKWLGIHSKHYYAFIDKIHVCDDKGNYKFNNSKDAQKAAEKYLKKLN